MYFVHAKHDLHFRALNMFASRVGPSSEDFRTATLRGCIPHIHESNDKCENTHNELFLFRVRKDHSDARHACSKIET